MALCFTTTVSPINREAAVAKSTYARLRSPWLARGLPENSTKNKNRKVNTGYNAAQTTEARAVSYTHLDVYKRQT